MLTLVTGSTGLLGNNVVRRLLDRGDRVRVLIRHTSQRKPLEELNVEVVVGELSDLDCVHASMHGVDQVVHSAGFVRIGWSDIELAREVNVEATRTVCTAALERNLPLVHVSTVNTLGLGTSDSAANEDTSPVDHIPCSYVVSKSEAEEVVQEFVKRGLRACIVNPGFMLGPWDWKPSSGQMVVEVATRFTPIAPPGGCSVVDVRDVAQGIALAMEKGRPGRRYILGGENMPYFDLWRLIASVTGARGPIRKMSSVSGWVAGSIGDFRYRLRGKEPLINSAAIKIARQFHYYDSGRAREELGYQARPARESVEAAWDWFLRYGYIRSKAVARQPALLETQRGHQV